MHGFARPPDHRDGHPDRGGEVDDRADDRGGGAGGIGTEQVLGAEEEELDVPGWGREQDGGEPEREEGEGGEAGAGDGRGGRRGGVRWGGRGRGGAGRAHGVHRRVSCTGGAAGAMSPGELLRTDPTARETGCQLSSGPGAASISSTAAGSVRSGSSHGAMRSGVSMTGSRSWISSNPSRAAAVRIVVVSTHRSWESSGSSGFGHQENNPAKAIDSPWLGKM